MKYNYFLLWHYSTFLLFESESFLRLGSPRIVNIWYHDFLSKRYSKINSVSIKE